MEPQCRQPGTPDLVAYLGSPYSGMTRLHLICRVVPSCHPSVPPDLLHTSLAVLSVSLT